MLKRSQNHPRDVLLLLATTKLEDFSLSSALTTHLDISREIQLGSFSKVAAVAVAVAVAAATRSSEKLPN